MKLILLAATALIASPVIAQDTTAGTPTTQTTPPAADPAQTPPTDPGATAGTGDTMAAPSATQAQPSTNAPDGTSSADPAAQPTTAAPAGTATGDPVGGYQPTAPAVSGGTATPGGPVTFQAAPPPSQAYPAPAPLASYPICKKGQYDKCRQRGGK